MNFINISFYFFNLSWKHLQKVETGEILLLNPFCFKLQEEDEAAEREEKRNQGRQNFHMEERKRKQSVEQARLSMYA